MGRFPREMTHGSGARMTLDPNRILVSYVEPPALSQLRKAIGTIGCVLEDEEGKEPQLTLAEKVNHTDRRFWLRFREGTPTPEMEVEQLEQVLSSAGKIEFVAPVYRLGPANGRNSLVCSLPNVLIVRPGSESAAKTLSAKLKKYGLREDHGRSRLLGEFRYFVLTDMREQNAYELRGALLEREKDSIGDVILENMPMVMPTTAIPNDTLYAQQWNMAQIQAGGPGNTGWDISTGAATVIIAIIDTGVDQTHPDLVLAGAGINMGTMNPPGAPVMGNAHGTSCAGVAAATFNNAAGVSGVAGGCQILPVAMVNWTDVEVAAAINWASTNGANVISMSFGVYGAGEGMGPTGWNFAVIDPAIANAVAAGVVLVAATGNENVGTFNRYPARNAQVVAVGGSDQADNRKSPTSPDGECWGANFAAGFSVVAPAVNCPTTDIQGAAGYNANNGGAGLGPCVNWASVGDAAGDYFLFFDGTSSATPHVAGLAGLLLSRYPLLTNQQARAIIERTADKVGGIYADAAGFNNGTRNAQMGYGRINVYQSLDFADTYIKDWSGDDGVEPSSPPGGDFWDFSDIVLRPFDDNVFMPGDPLLASNVERGQVNYVYVRVTNNGPREARNVTVDCRITPWVGLEFVYPGDWTAVDAMHVSPTPVLSSFATVPAGGSVIAKFSVTSAQVETLWGWISSNPWHPCLLARVLTDNDYAFASANLSGGSLIVRRNNLAQRNLSVIDVIPNLTLSFPFVAGNSMSESQVIEIAIDASRFAKESELILSLDDDGTAFPALVEAFHGDGHNGNGPNRIGSRRTEEGMVFLDRTRIRTSLGGCGGILTLEKGSRFDAERHKQQEVRLEGGHLFVENGRRFVNITEPFATVRVEKEPYEMLPLSLQTTIPAFVEKGERLLIEASQRDARGETVGGATAVYVVR